MENYMRSFSKHAIKCFIIISAVLYLTEISYNNKAGNDLTKSTNYVILTSSLKPRYLFVLPFTAASWINLGVKPIVVLVGKEEDFISHYQANETVALLKELNAYIIFMQPKKLSNTSFSQLVRLFAAALPLPWISDNDIVITSDADLAVFHLNNHIPNATHGKIIHLYNANCCEPVRVPPLRGSYRVHMYPMGTIGATIKTWKNIMGFNQSTFNTDKVESYIINEFGENFVSVTDEQMASLVGSPIWYADQSLISYKLHIWLQNQTNKNFVSTRTTPPRRIDRIAWPTEKQFAKMYLSEWDDCHQPVDAFNGQNWEIFKPFLDLVFEKDLVSRFHQYQIDFLFKFLLH